MYIYTYIYVIYIYTCVIYIYMFIFQHLESRWHNSHVTVFIYQQPRISKNPTDVLGGVSPIVASKFQ